MVTNENGAVTSRKDFTAFGEENVSAQRTSALAYSGQDEIRNGYTGYEKDSESGLDFAQARYYSSTHGRYTSVDPLTASASIRNPQTFNRYSYVLNSPYKFTDPLGLLPASSSGPGFYGCSAEFSSCGDDGWGTWVDGPTEDSQTEEADPPVTQETEQEHSDGQQQAQQAEPPPEPNPTNAELPIEGPFIVSADKLAKFGTEEDYINGTAPQFPAVGDGKCPKLPQSLVPNLGQVQYFVQGNVLYRGSEADRRDPIYENNSGVYRDPKTEEGRYPEIARGTVIFTPNSRGEYNNEEYGNHVAIFLSYGRVNGRGGIFVVDQYPDRTEGRATAGIRFISAKSGAVTDPSNDARAFAVVYAIRPRR